MGPDQRLDDVAKAALRAAQSFEARLSALSARIDELRDELDAQRQQIEHEREELDIEYSLEQNASYILDSPAAAHLRNAERQLAELMARAGMLQRQINEFISLVALCARGLRNGQDIAASDAAARVAMRAAAAEAQETERQRLAREIHDGPAQALANAIIALEFVERAIRAGGDNAASRALEEVERIKASLREGLTEIRRFIFDLRPTMLQDRGLAATVEHYVATYQSLFPMSINVQSDKQLPRLSADQELTAFRIIQEAIQNARKHARATTVDVRIARDDGWLRVSISDNGRGFSPDRVTTHLMGGEGLRGMRERAALVGGELQIESAPGEGTRILLSIPLASNDEEPQGRADGTPPVQALDGEGNSRSTPDGVD